MSVPLATTLRFVAITSRYNWTLSIHFKWHKSSTSRNWIKQLKGYKYLYITIYVNIYITFKKKIFFQLNTMHCNTVLETDSLDIDNYLPIKSSAEAIRFCENHDGLLEQRKKALQRRVYAASDTSNMANFVASVANIFFHTNYQISHRWNAKQFVKLIFFPNRACCQFIAKKTFVSSL